MELLQYSFSDLYINSNKDFYISDENMQNSLKRVEPSDKEEFCEQLVLWIIAPDKFLFHELQRDFFPC